MSGEMIEFEIARLTAERDNWQHRAEAAERAVQVRTTEIHCLTAERDGARAERDAFIRQRDVAEKNCRNLNAEVEGLRADLLAHPPETHTELAAERQRHLELMEDYDRQNVMIGILEDAVKRAENALKVAQAKHVNPRIPGYAATIAQLASQIEDLLS